MRKTIGGEILKEELIEQDKFKGIGLDMMKTTIDELNKAKARERELDIYKGIFQVLVRSLALTLTLIQFWVIPVLVA